MNPTPVRPHGGPDASGPAAFDFSTNSNAAGPCPHALAAVQAADATRYPDPGYTALRTRLAARHGVAPWRIVIAASASEAIFRLTAWAARQGVRRAVLPAHAYGDYAQAATAWGLEVTRRGVAPAKVRPGQAPERLDGVSGTEDASGRPVAALPGSAATGTASAASTRTAHGSAEHSLEWHCDPSSPLGQADARASDMAGVPSHTAVADRPSPLAITVLDRAYAPLRLHGTDPWQGNAADAVWQLWTPNKALGLTGVRAAYCIAPRDAADAAAALEALAPSWPVGAHGVALLEAWCDPAVADWLARSLDLLREWKVAQQSLCRSLGWTVLPSDGNFFCARPAVSDLRDLRDLPGLLARLRAQGVQLRDCGSFGLPGHVRLGVLPPPAQQALGAAVRATTTIDGHPTHDSGEHPIGHP